jgi:predicted tellurium resistance membrane protein TerC
MSFLPNFSDPNFWVSLLTLTFLEIVLGVDNIIFITIATNKLAENEQGKARTIGLALAMLFRIILLFGISFIISMSSPFAHFGAEGGYFYAAPTGQSVILALGGLFLLYKSTTEIHHKLESDQDENESDMKNKTNGMMNAIIQIAIINIVFSFDSILTAVGLTDNVPTMMMAVIISVVIMMLFSGAVGTFVNNHPTVQMLGLAFLILIGFALIAEGAHQSHFSLLKSHVGEVPKGYLYFAIAFSLLVEYLNIKMNKKSKKPIQLHGYQEQAAKDGTLDDDILVDLDGDGQ